MIEFYSFFPQGLFKNISALLSPPHLPHQELVPIAFVLSSAFVAMWLENVVCAILLWGLNEALSLGQDILFNSPGI